MLEQDRAIQTEELLTNRKMHENVDRELGTAFDQIKSKLRKLMKSCLRPKQSSITFVESLACDK